MTRGWPRHIVNARLKTDARGPRLAKESKHSTARIDLAVAAVMSLDRVSSHTKPVSAPRVVDLAAYL
ncbi:MAG: hypothetical protein JO246_14620 [Frankiaceae bacterium]|nr:hypothetical protein [Frankiaceae bacterium]